jgi:hypothetical protein
MPEQDAYLLQVLIGQISEHREINSVLGKALGVLPEAQLLKPIGDLLHRGSAPDYRASSARIGKTTRQIPNAVGSMQYIPREWPHLDTARWRTAGQLSRVLPDRRPAARRGPPMRQIRWPAPRERVLHSY